MEASLVQAEEILELVDHDGRYFRVSPFIAPNVLGKEDHFRLHLDKEAWVATQNAHDGFKAVTRQAVEIGQWGNLQSDAGPFSFQVRVQGSYDPGNYNDPNNKSGGMLDLLAKSHGVFPMVKGYEPSVHKSKEAGLPLCKHQSMISKSLEDIQNGKYTVERKTAMFNKVEHDIVDSLQTFKANERGGPLPYRFEDSAPIVYRRRQDVAIGFKRFMADRIVERCTLLDGLNLAHWTGYSMKSEFPMLLESSIPAVQYLCQAGRNSLAHSGIVMPHLIDGIVVVAGALAVSLEGFQKGRFLQGVLVGQHGRFVYTSMQRQGFPTIPLGMLLLSSCTSPTIARLFGSIAYNSNYPPVVLWRSMGALLKSRAEGITAQKRQKFLETIATILFQNIRPIYYEQLLSTHFSAYLLEGVRRAKLPHRIKVEKIVPKIGSKSIFQVKLAKCCIDGVDLMPDFRGSIDLESLLSPNSTAKLLARVLKLGPYEESPDSFIDYGGAMSVGAIAGWVVENVYERIVEKPARDDRASGLYFIASMLRSIAMVVKAVTGKDDPEYLKTKEYAKAVLVTYMTKSKTKVFFWCSRTDYRKKRLHMVSVQSSTTESSEAETLLKQLDAQWLHRFRKQFLIDLNSDSQAGAMIADAVLCISEVAMQWASQVAGQFVVHCAGRAFEGTASSTRKMEVSEVVGDGIIDEGNEEEESEEEEEEGEEEAEVEDGGRGGVGLFE